MAARRYPERDRVMVLLSVRATAANDALTCRSRTHTCFCCPELNLKHRFQH